MLVRKIIKDKKFYSEIGRKGVLERWKKIHSKIRINPNLSLDKIRINAYLCGDGNINIRKEKNSCHYEIRFFPDNIDIAYYYCECFFNEFGIKPSIRKQNNYFRVEIKNKPVCLSLLSLSKYSGLNWNMPDMNSNQKIEWIKCFFDCEAYVNQTENTIQVKSINSKGLFNINNNLKNLGIKSKIYGPYKQYSKNQNDYYVLNIAGKDNILRYQKLINFNHPDKKCALNKLVKI